MKKFILFLLAIAAVVFSASTCEKMEPGDYRDKGIGYTKDMSGAVLDSWHYVTYRASVTIFTNAEWDNNRSLGEDDSNYRHGKTYAFHVVDENTISSEEKVSSNSYIVNFFTRLLNRE